MASSKEQNPWIARPYPGWLADSRSKFQALKAAKFRVQQHCAGVAHFLLSFHPDHHALPLWLTRFIEQLSCQVPGQRTWKQCVSHCAAFIWSTQVLGPGQAGKLALTVQSKHESDGSACVHTKSIQLRAKHTNATRCYPMLPASFCISGVCWIETSYVTVALANIGMQ